MSKYEYLRAQIGGWLHEHGAGAVVAVSPENVLHTSGAYIASQRLIRDRLAMTIFPLDAEPAFLVGDVVHRTASAETWIEDTRAYVEHQESPMEGLARILKEKGLGGGMLAVETRYLPAVSYLELTGLLPEVEIIDAESILDATRMIKSQDEIELMRHNALAAEKAIEYGYLFSHPGDSEIQLVRRMRKALLELGCEWNPFITLAAGTENTLEGHHRAGDEPILAGDIVRVDMVGFWRGYYTDFARMAVVGEPKAAQRDAYGKVFDVQRHVMDAARPGVSACDLHQDCVEYARQIGMPFDMDAVGHSLGIGLHEHPILGPRCDTKLQVGMTLCIEIASRVPGLGLFHVEDLILLQDYSNRRLTDHMDTTEMLVIR